MQRYCVFECDGCSYLVPTKLAAAVYDCLMTYKDTNPNFLPATETCELLILDRSVDQVFKCTYIGYKITSSACCAALYHLNYEIKQIIS